ISVALGAAVQLSFTAMVAWSAMRTKVTVGSDRGLLIPNAASEGPLAVITTVLLAAPSMTMPAMATLSPSRISMRVDMLPRRDAWAGTARARNAPATRTAASERILMELRQKARL